MVPGNGHQKYKKACFIARLFSSQKKLSRLDGVVEPRVVKVMCLGSTTSFLDCNEDQ